MTLLNKKKLKNFSNDPTLLSKMKEHLLLKFGESKNRWETNWNENALPIFENLYIYKNPTFNIKWILFITIILIISILIKQFFF